MDEWERAREQRIEQLTEWCDRQKKRYRQRKDIEPMPAPSQKFIEINESVDLELIVEDGIINLSILDED